MTYTWEEHQSKYKLERVNKLEYQNIQQYERKTQQTELEYYSLLCNQFNDNYSMLCKAIRELTTSKLRQADLFKVIEDIRFVDFETKKENYYKIEPFINELLDMPLDTFKDYQSIEDDELLSQSSWELQGYNEKLIAYDIKGNVIGLFNNISVAAKDLCLNQNLIGQCVNGLVPTVQGISFKMKKNIKI